MAGKRAGLKHSANGDDETTRSGLFMEAVRIIKEMRRATNGEYPKYAIWENVMGAFSSNSGEDFRVVLEELVKICEPEAPPIPSPGKAGWAYADCIVGDGWSLAWRVFDAQHWGVAQRRRRVYALLDLTDGTGAGKILFESPGLRGYFEEGRTPWQGAAEDPQGSPGADDTESGIAEQQQTFIIDSIGGQAERAWESETAPCLKASHYKFPPSVTVAAGFCTEHSAKARSVGYQKEVAPTLRAGTTPACVYSVENHPADSRVDIDDSGKVQTLTSRMGTGGGNVPMVLEQVVYRKGTRPHSADEAQKWEDADVANTLNTFDQGEARANELVVEGTPVYCLQGNGIDRADTAGCNGKGWAEDVCYTLNTIDRPAVSYATDVGLLTSCEETSPTMLARMHKDPHTVAYGLDRASFNQGENAQYGFSTLLEQQPTLTARGPGAVCKEYIVRRLTPTECARLQGFPDRWGDIPQKDTLTDEEYSFWLDVRNTHAAINGRSTKEYTKEQMLKWYNKLHSDSSEYKMWGNGIALPNALYVMQGIAEVMNNARI